MSLGAAAGDFDSSLDSPEQLLLQLPEEDSGTETADRYEFQYNVVARHCCEMLHNAYVEYVLCEWHTDYIICVNGIRIMVSVKHREPERGPWTISRILSDGGLSKLCQRWLALGGSLECRFVTNAILATDLKELQRTFRGEDLEKKRSHSATLAPKLGYSEDETFSFLCCLYFESVPADRRLIRAHHVERYMRPALKTLGMSTLDEWEAYDSIVSVVREAARDFDDDLASAVSMPGHLRDNAQLDATLARRKIDCDRARSALAAVPADAAPILESSSEQTHNETVLVKKLRHGEINETSIAAARRLRRSWSVFSAKYSAPLPGAPDIVDDLTTRVLHHVGRVIAHVANEDGPYGERMLDQVTSKLDPAQIAPHLTQFVDQLHLLGLAYQLTDECHIWWSTRFPLDYSTEDSVPDDQVKRNDRADD